MRLVGPAGEQVGIVAINDALRLAQEADLDLVEVAPTARPPVCKLMDYGKFKYESALKARESRKNQAQTVIKEIKLRPKIDPHDYGTKKGHVERFLKQGDKVKVTIMFRGREQSRPELGFKLLQRLAGDIEELGFVESSPKQDGRNMIMVLGPHKRKTEAMAAAKADRASSVERAQRRARGCCGSAAGSRACCDCARARRPSRPRPCGRHLRAQRHRRHQLAGLRLRQASEAAPEAAAAESAPAAPAARTTAPAGRQLSGQAVVRRWQRRPPRAGRRARRARHGRQRRGRLRHDPLRPDARPAATPKPTRPAPDAGLGPAARPCGQRSAEADRAARYDGGGQARGAQARAGAADR